MVNSAKAPWVTAKYSFKGKPTAVEYPEPFNSGQSVLRAGGIIFTAGRFQGRYELAVEDYRQ